ncbi:NAD-dependent epimerase/dehydratase family protein [Bacillus sp. ISL-47]|uniref:NAD-dependent epimerase/dehydratase family protein n=1 Tax=Bacillus sp. ISL-47 TaxID=2819130 RepID=UPI001BECA05C|nr:NAD-dependent epimerase/dehydratase family protein [Bacillus sp. ISL-47]MBT2691015.1 NAD-dependent epimerase/dehydratase family protein [Bacillus sp. ISL-47]MBT2710890.1 NAD-dependent epimerase/dehydratase family protein [Pseudomonas sp. ISL-84]
MQDILVLGGTQFFGKRLVEKLLRKEKNVTIATRGLTKDSFGDSVERLTIDRGNKESQLDAFSGRKWDLVYDQSCFSPQEAKDTAEALDGKVAHYIFTSSMAVYDFGTNHKEGDFKPEKYSITYKPRNEYKGYEGYQEAKRAAEAVLLRQQGFKTSFIRFPIVIGKDDYTNRLKFHVDKVKNREPIGIHDIEARYSFILSGEAADFLYRIGETAYTGAFNPGSEGDLSLNELLNKIENITLRKAFVTDKIDSNNASPYALPGSWSISTERVKSLGFTFSDLHETLDNLIRFYLIEQEK